MVDTSHSPEGNGPESLPIIPQPEPAHPHNPLAQWLLAGGRLDQQGHAEETYRWDRVVWLTGVDYFSSLAYQPGIALIAAGALSPIATLILVCVTLFCALPVYVQVASRSYAGQGSIAMLENLLKGWRSKIFVLILLGFAATDFVITMTLSAADAARHAIENPIFHPYLAGNHMALTIGSLTLLAIVFLVGFREAIRLAAIVAIPYLALNVIVFIACLMKIAVHPDLLRNWLAALHSRADWTSVIIASVLVFPKLALGLSGFETGVSVMPLVSNDRQPTNSVKEPAKDIDEGPKASIPKERIRGSQKLLTTAALIMAVFLLLSSFVTTLLIPPEAYQIGGPASGRAPAYLAHQLLGNTFGTVYDLSTIAILWFAGASAMAGLVNLIPRYLPRFGMAPNWVSYQRPMVIVLFAMDLFVTCAFQASVERQGGAYATGVLVLILSAAVAVTIALWREFQPSPRKKAEKGLFAVFFGLVSVVFGYTLIANIIERPDGVIISAVFIFALLALSAVSRYQRATELRVADVTFVNRSSADLWSAIVRKKVHLVPYGIPGEDARSRKAAAIRARYKTVGAIAFLHVFLLDNRSEFDAKLHVRVFRQEDDFVIQVHGAVAVANTIAYIIELVDPKSVFLNLTGQNLMKQAFKYLILGEGEVGLTVYSMLVRHWEKAQVTDSRPTLYLVRSGFISAEE